MSVKSLTKNSLSDLRSSDRLAMAIISGFGVFCFRQIVIGNEILLAARRHRKRAQHLIPPLVPAHAQPRLMIQIQRGTWCRRRIIDARHHRNRAITRTDEVIRVARSSNCTCPVRLSSRKTQLFFLGFSTRSHRLAGATTAGFWCFLFLGLFAEGNEILPGLLIGFYC